MKKILPLTTVIVVALSPYLRGLFFPMEQLPFALCIGITFLAWSITAYQHIRFNATDWVVLILPTLYFVAIPTAVNKYAALLTAILTLAPTLVYFIASRLPQDRLPIARPIAAILSVSAGVVALLGILSYAHLVSFVPASLNGDRLASVFQYANTAGAFLGLALILTLGQLLQSPSIVTGALHAGNLFFLTVALILTFSRGTLLAFPLVLLAYLVVLPNEFKVQAVATVGGIGLAAFGILSPLQTAINAKQSSQVLLLLGSGLLLSSLIGVAAYGLARALRRVVSVSTRSTAALKRIAMVVVLLLVLVSAWPLVTRLSGAIQSMPTQSAKRVSDITLDTNSAWTRFMFMGNGAQIALRHPILGVGGGGYASLYSITQEVQVIAKLAHSHPIQVWVEAGTLALLAYLLVWIAPLRDLTRLLLKEQSSPKKLQGLTLFCSAGVVGVHSLIDFDMSFLSVQLWVLLLLGLLRAVTGARQERGHSSNGLPIRFAKAAVIVPLIAASLATVPLAKAEWENYWGCEAYEQGRYDVAITRLQKAVSMVPINAKFHHDLANAYLAQNMTADNIVQAKHAAEQAIRYDPYSYEHHYLLLGIQVFQMDYLPAVEEATTLLRLHPKSQKNYDIAGVAYAYGLVEVAKSGDRDRVTSLSREIVTWPERFRNETSKLTVSKDISLALGTAHFFLGNWQEAERYITNAEKNNFMKPEIYRWLALIYEKSGNKAAYDKLINRVPYLKMTFINEDYQMLRNY